MVQFNPCKEWRCRIWSNYTTRKINGWEPENTPYTPVLRGIIWTKASWLQVRFVNLPGVKRVSIPTPQQKKSMTAPDDYSWYKNMSPDWVYITIFMYHIVSLGDLHAPRPFGRMCRRVVDPLNAWSSTGVGFHRPLLNCGLQDTDG